MRNLGEAAAGGPGAGDSGESVLAPRAPAPSAPASRSCFSRSSGRAGTTRLCSRGASLFWIPDPQLAAAVRDLTSARGSTQVILCRGRGEQVQCFEQFPHSTTDRERGLGQRAAWGRVRTKISGGTTIRYRAWVGTLAGASPGRRAGLGPWSALWAGCSSN